VEAEKKNKGLHIESCHNRHRDGMTNQKSKRV